MMMLPTSITQDLPSESAIPDSISNLKHTRTLQLTECQSIALQHGIRDPAAFAFLLEATTLKARDDTAIQYRDVWAEAKTIWQVMKGAVDQGLEGQSRTSFVSGNWGQQLATSQGSMLGSAGWMAYTGAIAAQEHNAGSGLVAAAPTGGASGVLPGTLYAVDQAIIVEESEITKSLLIAGLLGLVAFSRGPVSGAQAGCGGEIGVAAMMAAGAVVYLLGGSWEEIDAAAALVGPNYVGLECSPARGLVEYPCIPRCGFAALNAIAAAESVMLGVHPPYNCSEVLDRIFRGGAKLPESLRETEQGEWAESLIVGS